ncbi:Syringolide-induced protein 14-1-1 [Quillaja saponaria]|uniref:Syringolide-induced protein 14-1-1 n=1 Tax=Quillaja saponaria TaxID=32244 RepID=A0AAD7PU53_QUISA|nr:Syringolide-induced protein 14-1-1 [Quillaja saponaria]
MEKQAKTKNKILKFLPKAAPAITFQSYHFSPGRDHHNARHKSHANKGFSGMIPTEARRKLKNGSFQTQEPTSPKISCMGQIKHKNKNINKAKSFSLPKDHTKPETTPTAKDVKKNASSFLRMFSSVKPAGRKSDASAADHNRKAALGDRAPSLSQMRRFASGRDTFANFDWRVAPVTQEELDHRSSYDWEDDRDDQESEEEEEEAMIPFSGPILVGEGVPLQPRKEINIWKRRTMAPPRPLELTLC